MKIRWYQIILLLGALIAGMGIEKRTRKKQVDAPPAKLAFGFNLGTTIDRYRNLIELLQEADDETLSEMFRLCSSSEFREIIAATWAEVDQAGMYAWLLADDQTSNSEFNLAAQMLFFTWAKTDAASALEGVEELGGHGRERHVAAAYAGWVSVDPNSALRSEIPLWEWPEDMYETVYRGSERTGFFLTPRETITGEDFWAWTEADPSAAMNLLLSVPESEMQRYGLFWAARELAKIDPLAALEKRRVFARRFTRYLAVWIAESWAKHDRAAAISWAGEYFDTETRPHVIYKLYEGVDYNDEDEMKSLLDQLEGRRVRAEHVRNGMRNWPWKSPASALAWARAEGDRDWEREVHRTWFQLDAEQWMREHPDEQLQLETVRSVVEDHLRYSEELWNLKKQTEAAVGFPPEMRGTALAVIALRGEPAIRPIMEQLHRVPAGEGRDELLMTLGTFFLKEKPAEAERWIGSLSEGDREIARRNLFELHESAP